MGQNLADRDDYYLVLIPTTAFYGQLLAETAIGKGFRTFGAISDSRNDPYCQTFIEGIMSGLGVGDSTTIKELTFQTSSDVPYSEIVAPLVLEDLDAVFLCASPFDTAMLAQNVKRISKDITLFSTSWGISIELVQNGGAAVEGLYFFLSIDLTDLSESFLRFQDSFSDRFDRDPSYVAIFNYEAVQYLAQCLAQDSGASPEKVKELLLRKEGFKGVQSSFKLDGEGDVIRPLILHTVRAGTFVRVQ
jgi:ABC-type branched-subunit amino acid transport system substrate-binding protein